MYKALVNHLARHGNSMKIFKVQFHHTTFLFLLIKLIGIKVLTVD